MRRGFNEAERAKNLAGIDQPSSSNIDIRLAQGFMERCTVLIIEPVARIERQELEFDALRKVCGFVNDKTAGGDTSLDRHECSVALERV